jgi:hypothetical protein
MENGTEVHVADCAFIYGNFPTIEENRLVYADLQ